LGIVLSVLLQFTASDYRLVFSYFSPLWCLSFDVWLLITSLVSSNLFTLFCLSLEIRLLIATLAASTFFQLCCLSVFALQVLITPLVSLNTRQIALSFLLRFTVSDYPFDIFNVSPLRCFSLFHLWLLITPLVSSNVWPLTGMKISDLRLNRYPNI
jgi:hypothetical protein